MLWDFSPYRCIWVWFFWAPLASGLLSGPAPSSAKLWPLLLTPHKKCSWVAVTMHLMHGMLDQERVICTAGVSGIFLGDIRQESAGSWSLLYLIKQLKNCYRVDFKDSTAFESSLGGTEGLICWVSVFSLDVRWRSWLSETGLCKSVDMRKLWPKWIGHKQQVSNRAGTKLSFPDFHHHSLTTRCHFYCHC